MSAKETLIESQAQCDQDGVMVRVSRQALMEFIGEYDALLGAFDRDHDELMQLINRLIGVSPASCHLRTRNSQHI